ncbi:MAG: helix-turn-helix domain-containing protein [Bacteroidales bacterium]|nr:helix-turn-helix domain-containing protein [Bacteroidales bacterium]
MNNVYMLADTAICKRIGGHLKHARLKQNITQQSLADAANVSLSSVKKIEKGEIGSFDSLLRVLRTLGLLNVLQPLVDEEQLSPSEYYNWVHSQDIKNRKRAVGKLQNKEKETTEW